MILGAVGLFSYLDSFPPLSFLPINTWRLWGVSCLLQKLSEVLLMEWQWNNKWCIECTNPSCLLKGA